MMDMTEMSVSITVVRSNPSIGTVAVVRVTKIGKGLALTLLAMLISAVPAPSAFAQPRFTATTACGALLRAIGVQDQAAIRAARSYIDDVMDERDAEYVASGRGSAIGGLSENTRVGLALAVTTFCDRDPQRTVKSASIEAYDEARAMHGQVGRLP
jgi:hypothetical protein